MGLTKAQREMQRELRRQQQASEQPTITKTTTATSVGPSPIVLAPVPIVEWHGCYDDSWRGMITPESFGHPAKAGRRLLHKIFDHLESLGVIPGSIVVDPFGGIFTTGLIGAWRGYRVVGCELEPRFVALAQANIAMQAPRLTEMHRPVPVIVQGDSRQLRTHVAGPIAAIVSSPPYAELGVDIKGHGIVGAGVSKDKNYGNAEYGHTDGQLGDLKEGNIDAVVSSPPFADQATHSGSDTPARAGVDAQGNSRGGRTVYQYGETSGQIGHMPSGEVDAVISSPPYEEIATGAGGLNTKPAKDGQQGGRSADSPSQSTDQRYGDSDGQLAKMEKGSVDVVVSSPPYAETAIAVNESGGGQINADRLKESLERKARGEKGIDLSDHTNLRYGTEDGQLGTLKAGDVDAVIASPPYAETLLNDDQQQAGKGEPLRWGTHKEYGESPGQLGVLKEHEGVDAVISSPPYAETSLSGGGGIAHEMRDTYREGQNYGDEPGQLGAMKEATGVDAIVSSPPYSSVVSGPGEEGTGSTGDATRRERMKNGESHENALFSGNSYGDSAGQLGEMPDSSVDAVVTSPPFGTGDSASAQSIVKRTDKSAEWVKSNIGSASTEGYGTSEGQMAEMSMKPGVDTFWTAARDIVRECYALLKPGGYAVWIVKAFVRDKQIVDFPGDWRKLCEYCGFETLTEVHAMLVKTGGHHGEVGLHGEVLVEKKERKSFFRRLAESKGSPKIDYEVVLIMRKR